jgi:hypothetical protein
VAFAHTLELDGDHATTLDADELRALIGDAGAADVISVLVMQDDPAERIEGYARYALMANGITQPGG